MSDRMINDQMKTRDARRLRSAGATLAAIIALTPGVSVANVLPRPGVTVRTIPVTRAPAKTAPRQPLAWHRVPPGPHTFYGTIAAISGSTLTIRLRSGRLQAVDATAAIAIGNFSAPLFIGKVVCVDGAVAGTTFTAAHVFRVTNLPELPADR